MHLRAVGANGRKDDQNMIAYTLNRSKRKTLALYVRT